MLLYFRKSKILYFTAAFLGAALILLPFGTRTVFVAGRAVEAPLLPFHIFLPGPAMAVPFLSLLVILWIFLCAFAANKIALTEYKKILALLTRDCDPPAYLTAADCRFRGKNIRSAAVRTMLALNAVTAYEAMDRFEDAEQILGNLGDPATFGRGRSRPVLQLMFHSLAASCCREDGNLENAAREIACMKALLASGKLPAKKLGTYRDLCRQQEYLRNMQQGDFTGALEFFTEQDARAETQLQKVNLQALLGGIHLHRSEPEQARPCLEYAVRYGNRLAVAGHAKELLEKAK